MEPDDERFLDLMEQRNINTEPVARAYSARGSNTLQ